MDYSWRNGSNFPTRLNRQSAKTNLVSSRLMFAMRCGIFVTFITCVMIVAIRAISNEAVFRELAPLGVDDLEIDGSFSTEISLEVSCSSKSASVDGKRQRRGQACRPKNPPAVIQAPAASTNPADQSDGDLPFNFPTFDIHRDDTQCWGGLYPIHLCCDGPATMWDKARKHFGEVHNCLPCMPWTTFPSPFFNRIAFDSGAQL